MLKNKLPISSIIGIGVISLSVFFLCIFAEIFYRDRRLDNLEDAIPLAIGLFLAFAGISTLLKLFYARTLLAITVILMSAVFIFTIGINVGNIFITIGFFCLGLGFPFTVLMILYNQKVSEEFGIEHQDKATEDILDLME